MAPYPMIPTLLRGSATSLENRCVSLLALMAADIRRISLVALLNTPIYVKSLEMSGMVIVDGCPGGGAPVGRGAQTKPETLCSTSFVATKICALLDRPSTFISDV